MVTYVTNPWGIDYSQPWYGPARDVRRVGQQERSGLPGALRPAADLTGRHEEDLFVAHEKDLATAPSTESDAPYPDAWHAAKRQLPGP